MKVLLKTAYTEKLIEVDVETVEEITELIADRFQIDRSELHVALPTGFIQAGQVHDYFKDGDTVTVAELGTDV